MFRVLGKIIFFLFTLLALGAGVFVVVFFWGRGEDVRSIPEIPQGDAFEEMTPLVNEERPVPGEEPGRDTAEKEITDSPKPTGSVFISDVPFTVQAPFGEWSDPHFQNACEEASILMAEHWRSGEPLSPQIAKEEIGEMEAFEEKRFGVAIDTSATDTLKLFQEYYKTEDGDIFFDITADHIRNALAQGSIVIVPADGRKLKNPNFVPPGPTRHMLVVTGYDEEKREFVTNDPGTRRGAGYRYPETVLLDAIGDYLTGDHLPDKDPRKVMIVIPKVI